MDHTSGAISVVVADDEPHVVEYLRMARHLEGFDIAGTASDADGVVQLVHHMHPDVALLDLRMPGGGLDAARLIASVSPETRIIVFSADADAPEILPLLQAGIDGFVVKGTPPDRLADAIRSAVAGGSYVAPQLNRVALDELTARLHAEERAVLHHNRTADRIRDVIASQRYQLAFQPIVDLTTGNPVAVEALTRFTTEPGRSPIVWYDEAERVGLRPSLELATASAAVGALATLQPSLSLAVNVSPATVLSGRLHEVLTGVDMARVVLEVTEHAKVDDYAALDRALQPWRRAGAKVAVDDAGGGYASFTHVLNLTPDFIKLDVTLVRDIHADTRRQALARAISGFARELGVALIAEGIETADELQVMVDLGTPLAQGFHLGRPRPLAEQPELLTHDDLGLRAARRT